MDLLEKIDLYVENINEESDYQKFVKKKLADTGKSLGDMNDEETKKFFLMLDKEWKSKDEKKQK
ncbi:MAG: hypothetical protein KQ78_02152 [Candidatus Izimaplasma bacterium HR2]|nr:MAG: hypothetical protein KQ78_02152 [Candidatus Izimaplasma bacterium HR2]